MSSISSIYDRSAWQPSKAGTRNADESFWTFTSLLTVTLYGALLAFVLYATVHGMGQDEIFLGQ